MGRERCSSYMSKPLSLKKPEPPALALASIPGLPSPSLREEAESPTGEIKRTLWRQSCLVLTSPPLTLLTPLPLACFTHRRLLLLGCWELALQAFAPSALAAVPALRLSHR